MGARIVIMIAKTIGTEPSRLDCSLIKEPVGLGQRIGPLALRWLGWAARYPARWAGLGKRWGRCPRLNLWTLPQFGFRDAPQEVLGRCPRRRDWSVRYDNFGVR